MGTHLNYNETFRTQNNRSSLEKGLGYMSQPVHDYLPLKPSLPPNGKTPTSTDFSNLEQVQMSATASNYQIQTPQHHQIEEASSFE